MACKIIEALLRHFGVSVGRLRNLLARQGAGLGGQLFDCRDILLGNRVLQVLIVRVHILGRGNGGSGNQQSRHPKTTSGHGNYPPKIRAGSVGL